MDYDARSGNNIGYNLLNLPQSISGSQNLSYTYDATGQKLRRQSANSSFGTEDYVSGVQYKNGTIEFVQTEEGRARRNSDGNYSYEYTLTDHLGNNRLSFDNSGGMARTIQQDDYFPFGLNYNRLSNGYKNNYLYNKKELQEELGV